MSISNTDNQILDLIRNTDKENVPEVVLTYIKTLTLTQQAYEIQTFFHHLASLEEVIDELVQALWDLIAQQKLFSVLYTSLRELKGI